MKTVLTGLILLCAHTGAAALDGHTSLQWSTQISAPQPAPQSAPDSGSMPELSAQSVLVFDQASGQPLLAKNASLQTPIASITKLMTAMLVLDADQPLDERITITSEDRDTIRGTGSRLGIGASYTRGQLLHLALIASDNRAAHALARTAPGGLERFIASMNRMARTLGMQNTVYVEPTGPTRKSARSPPPVTTPSAPSAWC
jgi:D-alanyl-D-alanine endopeptidase (penicillin-binding protein 7)